MTTEQPPRRRHAYLRMLFFLTVISTATAQFEGFGGGGGFGGGQVCPPYTPCRKDEEGVPIWPLKLESPGCAGLGGVQTFNVQQTGDNKKKNDPHERCCDLRHACLQTCGAKKPFCDEQFNACTKSACDNVQDDEDAKRACESTASINQLMIQLDSNCATYKAAQQSHCQCVPKSQASTARERVLRNFYKKYNPTQVDKVPGLAAKADTPAKMVGLLMKLYQKYYDNDHTSPLIKKIKNPQQDYMDQILKESHKKDKENNAAADAKEEEEDDDDVESDAEDLGTEEL